MLTDREREREREREGERERGGEKERESERERETDREKTGTIWHVKNARPVYEYMYMCRTLPSVQMYTCNMQLRIYTYIYTYTYTNIIIIHRYTFIYIYIQLCTCIYTYKRTCLSVCLLWTHRHITLKKVKLLGCNSQAKQSQAKPSQAILKGNFLNRCVIWNPSSNR